jgi:type I restriction enzyme S subunit
MQQLLTGQIRLKGFLMPWKTAPIGELLSIRHGKSQKEVESGSGTVPILGTGGLMGYALRALFDKPSVLIGRKGTINKPMFVDVPFWTVDTLFYSDVLRDNCAKFIYYRFCLIDWLQYNEASGVPSLNSRTIERIEIACPEADEQREIAKVISDLDEELVILEQRLGKTRDLKQGMMQQLLTGKVRLV